MATPRSRLANFRRSIRPKTIAVVLFLIAIAIAVDIGGTDPFVIAGLMLLGLAIVTVTSMVEIVDATERRALTVFGEYRRLLEPGIHFIPPFVSATHRFDMRTQMIDVPSQEAITRDNSPVTADAIVYIRVMDARRAYLEVDDYHTAVSNLAQTTLRAALGDMDLDDTLSKRREINNRIHQELDEPTDEWGIRVEAVEVRAVQPSQDVQVAMEQQTSAERRRRAMILEAQGERRSTIERAEGDKQSKIIRAQGQKESAVLEAQGDAIATVLEANAAESMGERAIVSRGLDTLRRIGEGPSRTYVVPQELTATLGRYGKQFEVGADGPSILESLEFDDETKRFLNFDELQATLITESKVEDRE